MMARADSAAPWMRRHHHRSLVNNTDGISRHSIRKLARTGGVKRIRQSVYQTAKDVVRAKLEELVPRAITYCVANGRKAVTSLDVVYAIKDTPGMGSTMGYGTQIHGSLTSFTFQPLFSMVPAPVDELKHEPTLEQKANHQLKGTKFRVKSVKSKDVTPIIKHAQSSTAKKSLEGSPTLYSGDNLTLEDMEMLDYELESDVDSDYDSEAIEISCEEGLAICLQYQQSQDRVARWVEDVEAALAEDAQANVWKEMYAVFDADAGCSAATTASFSTSDDDDDYNDEDDEAVESFSDFRPANYTLHSFFRAGKAGCETRSGARK